MLLDGHHVNVDKQDNTRNLGAILLPIKSSLNHRSLAKIRSFEKSIRDFLSSGVPGTCFINPADFFTHPTTFPTSGLHVVARGQPSEDILRTKMTNYRRLLHQEGEGSHGWDGYGEMIAVAAS